MLTPSMGGAIPFGVLCSMDVRVTPSTICTGQNRTVTAGSWRVLEDNFCWSASSANCGLTIWHWLDRNLALDVAVQHSVNTFNPPPPPPPQVWALSLLSN